MMSPTVCAFHLGLRDAPVPACAPRSRRAGGRPMPLIMFSLVGAVALHIGGVALALVAVLIAAIRADAAAGRTADGLLIDPAA